MTGLLKAAIRARCLWAILRSHIGQKPAQVKALLAQPGRSEIVVYINSVCLVGTSSIIRLTSSVEHAVRKEIRKTCEESNDINQEFF